MQVSSRREGIITPFPQLSCYSYFMLHTLFILQASVSLRQPRAPTFWGDEKTAQLLVWRLAFGGTLDVDYLVLFLLPHARS